MPDELKAKLREILFTAAGGITDMADSEIAQINQAYKDAGYTYISPHSAYLPSSVWYERLQSEIAKESILQQVRGDYPDAFMRAAKRAAGLE